MKAEVSPVERLLVTVSARHGLSPAEVRPASYPHSGELPEDACAILVQRVEQTANEVSSKKVFLEKEFAYA